MSEALELCKASGFIPVLAHPWEMADSEGEIRILVEAWAKKGLRGIEVYHPSAQNHGYAFLKHLAHENGLLVTGGSDFHQEGNPRHGAIGCMCNEWHSCDTDTVQLLNTLTDAQKAFDASSNDL